MPGDNKARALLGRFGWLFLCNAATIGQLTGELNLLDRQLREYQTAFRARWARFAELGIPYVFATAPMKELIYPEFLPDQFQIGAKSFPLDRLQALFSDEPNIEIVDPREPLRAAKRHAEVYFRTDTHLSAAGGHCVYETIVRQRCCKELGLIPRPLEDFPLTVNARFRARLAERDLAKVVDGELVQTDEAVPADYHEVAIMINHDHIEGELASNRIPHSYKVSKTRSTRIFEQPDRPDLPTAVVVGDSFMWRLIPFLLSHFTRLTCLWVPNPPFSVIEAERPDIVIQLMAERFLIRSPLMPDWELEPEPPAAFEPGKPPVAK